jgi:hypothetical protein
MSFFSVSGGGEHFWLDPKMHRRDQAVKKMPDSAQAI